MHNALTQPDAGAPIGSFTEGELARLSLFKDASLDAVLGAVTRCPVRVLKAGEVLVRAGEDCSTLYLVLSGRLRAQDPSGAVPDLLIKVGDSLGELFLMEGAVVAGTISAVEPTRLLAIDTETAWSLVNVSHAVARNLLTLLVERSRIGGSIGASRKLRSSYERHATLDEDTGLHNRKWLDSTLSRQVARSAMSGTPLGLLLIGIDDFIDYGAQFGPAASDHARYAVAQTLTNHVRPTDLVACYGRAEFAVVLPGADGAGACLVGERLRRVVSEAVVLMSDESILPSVTVSVGVALSESPSDATRLLKSAEATLQAARGAGGNRVCN